MNKEKTAIAKAVIYALHNFDQYNEIRENSLEEEAAFKLTISVSIANGSQMVEAKVAGSIKCTAEGSAQIGDEQLELNLDPDLEAIANEIERGNRD